MPTLFTYTIAKDTGSAPNPFGPACTLTICKPQIRRSAEVGDWIAGFGARRTARGDYHGRLVYAMRVTEKLSLRAYDERCRSDRRYAIKIPEWDGPDPVRQRGDCQYDFSGGRRPRQRPGAHDQSLRERDLGGRFALLSTDFWYFGRRAPPLPEHLRAIIPAGRSYRSRSNGPWLTDFVRWVRRRRAAHRCVLAAPIQAAQDEVSSCMTPCD